MKRLNIFILALFALLSVSVSARADEPSRISVEAGILAPYTLEGKVAYEHPMGYDNAWCVFGEAGTHWQTPVCHMFWKKYFWDGGIEYRHRLVRFKNGNFRIFFGGQVGTFTRACCFGIRGGFEYNHVFPNNWVFTVSQLNAVNFRRGDLFRNGVTVGLKIPL